MKISRETVLAERTHLTDEAPSYVELINETRSILGPQFGVTVDPVDITQFRQAVGTVFDDGDRAVNVTAIIRLLRELDVTDDYPGFVIDEVLGRELAGTIAGGQPQKTLAEATFHFIDIQHDLPAEWAGVDDLEAGVAAGFQTRLPGWEWQRQENPFLP